MNVGIIIWSDGQGDMSIHVVDENRWEQIKSIECFYDENESRQKYYEKVDTWQQTMLYLADKNPEDSILPQNCPKPVGNVIDVIHCQNGVFENVLLKNYTILGFLTLEFA